MTTRRDNHAHVYVIQDGDLVKIGSSIAPAWRHRRQIRRGELVYASPSFENGRIVEKFVHRALKAKGLRVKDEWFCLSVAEAVEAIEVAFKEIHVPEWVTLSTTLDRRVALKLHAWIADDPANRSIKQATNDALAEFLKKHRRI